MLSNNNRNYIIHSNYSNKYLVVELNSDNDSNKIILITINFNYNNDKKKKNHARVCHNKKIIMTINIFK